MTQLYLVRHGETDWNRARRIQGSTDIPLNHTGREQAAASGRLLSRRTWDGVFSSPLGRALETATIIAEETGLASPQTVDAIVERNYGTAEGMTGFEIDRMFPPGTEVPGRESRDEVANRVLPALLALAEEHPGTSLIVVSHGGVIRSVLNAVDPESSREPIRNGSIHSFRHVDGELQLIAFDDPIEVESLDYAQDELEEQNAIEGREAEGRESAGIGR
jgi:probable phosphoglycerate mutase